MTDPVPDANLSAAQAAISAEVAQEAGAVAAPDYAAIVASWFNAFIANSPASRDVIVVNYLNQTAVPALVAALKGA